MDNANGPNIVADIAHISEVAEGTFICHEDPTCFKQSRALYDMHKHYSAACIGKVYKQAKNKQL